MARVTARKAYLKAKERQEGKRNKVAAKAKKHLDPSNLEQPQQVENPLDQELSSQDNKSIFASTKRTRARKGLENNRKITEFYQILKRGRENLPKSPRVTRSPNVPRMLEVSNIIQASSIVSSTRLTKALPDDPSDEVITIDDSDDDSDDAQRSQATQDGCDTRLTEPEISLNNSQFSGLETKLKLEEDPSCPSPSCKLESFKDLKVEANTDEDVEVLDVLPPIPLRDHPVFDLDDVG